MEQSQEQIIFENTCLRLACGDFRGYNVGSVGNVIHYLHGYGLIDYDRVQIGFNDGIGTVELFGEVIATFQVTKDHPVFSFGENHQHIQDRQTNYIECLDKFPNPCSF